MRETLERLADCFACSAAFRRALYESDETMYFLLMEVASHPPSTGHHKTKETAGAGDGFTREVDTVTVRFDDNDQITFRLHDSGRIGVDYVPEDFEAVSMRDGLQRILLALTEQLCIGKCKFIKEDI